MISAVVAAAWFAYVDIKATEKDTAVALKEVSTDVAVIKGSRFTMQDGVDLQKGIATLNERVARIEEQHLATTELVKAVNAQGEVLGGIRTDVEWIKRSFKDKQ